MAIAACRIARRSGGRCSREPDARTYQLTGQILVVKPETNEVLVKHEDIPGFMPAMTMPYTVKDAALIQGARAGRPDHGDAHGRAEARLPVGDYQDRLGAATGRCADHDSGGGRTCTSCRPAMRCRRRR